MRAAAPDVDAGEQEQPHHVDEVARIVEGGMGVFPGLHAGEADKGASAAMDPIQAIKRAEAFPGSRVA